MEAKVLRFLGTAYLMLHGQTMVEDGAADQLKTRPIRTRTSPLSIRAILAEDSKVVRKAVARILNDDPEVELIAESVSLHQTIQLANQLQPDVIVMDLHMGSEGGLTPWEVKSSFARHQVLAICVWTDSESQELARSLGAAVLLDKSKLAAELIPAIKQYASR